MESIYIRNLDQAEWHKHTQEEIDNGADPDLRFCFLVDRDIQASHGLSIGCLVLPVGGELPPHRHKPQELYVIKSGTGEMHLPDMTTRPVRENDFVYIPENERHGLINTGETPLEILWIFPTDSFRDVEYGYLDEG